MILLVNVTGAYTDPPPQGVGRLPLPSRPNTEQSPPNNTSQSQEPTQSPPTTNRPATPPPAVEPQEEQVENDTEMSSDRSHIYSEPSQATDWPGQVTHSTNLISGLNDRFNADDQPGFHIEVKLGFPGPVYAHMFEYVSIAGTQTWTLIDSNFIGYSICGVLIHCIPLPDETNLFAIFVSRQKKTEEEINAFIQALQRSDNSWVSINENYSCFEDVCDFVLYTSEAPVTVEPTVEITHPVTIQYVGDWISGYEPGQDYARIQIEPPALRAIRPVKFIRSFSQGDNQIGEGHPMWQIIRGGRIVEDGEFRLRRNEVTGEYSAIMIVFYLDAREFARDELSDLIARLNATDGSFESVRTQFDCLPSDCAIAYSMQRVGKINDIDDNPTGFTITRGEERANYRDYASEPGYKDLLHNAPVQLMIDKFFQVNEFGLPRIHVGLTKETFPSTINAIAFHYEDGIGGYGWRSAKPGHQGTRVSRDDIWFQMRNDTQAAFVLFLAHRPTAEEIEALFRKLASAGPTYEDVRSVIDCPETSCDIAFWSAGNGF